MPELPEVETTKASLQPLLKHRVQKVAVFQSKLRWPIPDNIVSLKGYVLANIERRAKYLILHFANDVGNKDVIIHLGMSGSLQQFPVGTAKRKHDHLIMTFASGDKDNEQLQLHYHDPRRFGAILWYDDYADKLLQHLGLEPLDDQFSGQYLYTKIHRIEENLLREKTNKMLLRPISRPIKSVIMDQELVVGVGNIYATESLFLSQIHPNTAASSLSEKQLHTLAQHIQSILQKAIQKGGSTLRDFTVADGTTGYFQQTLMVYGKYQQPCPKCHTIIDKITINGRASTFCPVCQPLCS